jgi:hypothetical protein
VPDFGAMASGDGQMSMEISAATNAGPVDVVGDASPVAGVWFETALTVIFAAATMLFVSFVAVAAGLV